MSAKLRSTVAVLLVALSVGAASTAITPTDAQARPNDGRYQQSSEAMRKKQEEANCGGLQAEYDIFQEGMAQAQKDGKWKQYSQYRKAADSRHREAFGAGCGWAQ